MSDDQNISNTACIRCGKILTIKSWDGGLLPSQPVLRCEHCGCDLRLVITKENGRVFLKIPEELAGYYLPKIVLQ